MSAAPALIARMPADRQRLLALALLVLAVVAGLALLLGPVLFLHRHYDTSIADTTDRLARYRRVAAQAPALRRALDVMKEKDGHRFFLRNTAPNLAGAEFADLVRAAIENNGGRITTSQNPVPHDDGRFKQLSVNVNFFATMPALAKILQALDAQQPLLAVDTLTVRPLNAFRGFRPAAGQEPELNIALEASAWAYPEPGKAPAPAVAAPPGK
jgi:hypothetical protein